MKKSDKITLIEPLVINSHSVTHVIIGQHYLEKHSSEVNDELILQLVTTLNGQTFQPDSTTSGIQYFVADIHLKTKLKEKYYRLIWLFEGDYLEILGVINAFRVKKKKSEVL
jgi:hypothetical protein